MAIDRKKSAILGFATDLGGQFLLIAVNFIVIPIILKMTSASLYGFWITTLSILGFLALADFGLGISLTRLVAGNVDEEKKEDLNQVVSSAFFVFCLVGAVYLSLGLCILPFIPGWFKIPAGEVLEVRVAFCIALFSGAVTLPLSTFGAVVSGFQRMAVDNTIRVVMSLAAMGISIVLLLCHFGLPSLAISGLFQSVSIGLINFIYIRRKFSFMTVRPRNVRWAHVRNLLSFGGYFQLGRVANSVATGADNLIISSCMGASFVTPYSITSKLAVTFSNGVASKAPIALFPAISQMFAKKEFDKLQRMFVRLTEYSTRLAIIACVFLILANQSFVSLWVGKDLYGGDYLNAVFCFWVIQDTIYRGTTAFVYASGELKNWMYASLFEAIFNLVISVILVFNWGLIGVALGTSIAKMLTTAFYIPYWICKKLDIRIWKFFREAIFIPAIRSIPGMLMLLCFLLLSPKSITWGWVLSVATISLVSNMIFFEGYELLKPSKLTFRERLRQMMTY